MRIINEFISTILQLAFLTLVPFVFFLLRENKAITFSSYIGLYRPSAKSMIYSIITVVILFIGALGVIYLDEDVKKMVFSPNSVTGKIRLMGPSFESVIILLLIAWIKTSLAEEIFFRGLIAKRLVTGLGFGMGNALQAVLFGLVHILLFWKIVGASAFPLIFIFVLSTFGGWVIGYIKEKQANGSIVPGWIAHGLANTLSYTIIAFVL